MFDKYCDYAVNRLDKGAIVCQSVTGDPIRLTPDQFSSMEEFERWKAWSDEDYHEIQKAGRQDDDCISLSALGGIPVPSAEEVFLAPQEKIEQAKAKALMLETVRQALTEKQYRRLRLYYLEGKTEAQIAQLEGVGQQRISNSLIAGAKIVERFFREFLRQRG